MVADWQEYQEKAAVFFASLGYDTALEATVGGARGTHDVDVLVQFRQFGIEHLWIVECKAWKRRVTKREVLTLRSVVEDAGADRGFLLSEQGFQAGAVIAARASNVVLTNLELLSDAAHDEVLELKRRQLEQRVIAVDGRMINLAPLVVGDDGGFERHETARTLLQSLDHARFGRLDAAHRALEPGGIPCLVREKNFDTLLAKVEAVVTELEVWRDSLGESSSDLVDRLIADDEFLANLKAEMSDALVGSPLDASWSGVFSDSTTVDGVVSLGSLDLIGMYTLYGTPMPYFSSNCELSLLVRGVAQVVAADVRFELSLAFPSGDISEFRLGSVRPSTASQ